jgi:uncharacterized protein YndB with AHSA1/START domain
MIAAPAETRSVIVEREFPHPPEKLWRALTQPHLIAEWLMKNDFAPIVGQRFNLTGDWGGVLDCEVLEIEPNKTLSYTWNFAHADPAFDLRSIVTFTLSRQARGLACAWNNRASAGPEAGVRGRQGRMGAVPGQTGAGSDADRLRPACNSSQNGDYIEQVYRQSHRWLSMIFTVIVAAIFHHYGGREGNLHPGYTSCRCSR